MNDAEIFKNNVKNICEKRGLRMTKVDTLAGYHKGNCTAMAVRGASVSTLHIKQYAKALKVDPAKLMEGIF